MSRSLTAPAVVRVLQYLFAVRGRPEHICRDNGPEFVAKAVVRRLERADVGTLFTAKASPWENGYVESFNGKLADELLNRELFVSLEEARWVIDRWRMDYNHSSSTQFTGLSNTRRIRGQLPPAGLRRDF